MKEFFMHIQVNTVTVELFVIILLLIFKKGN